MLRLLIHDLLRFHTALTPLSHAAAAHAISAFATAIIFSRILRAIFFDIRQRRFRFSYAITR